jgi:hypothetical protein
MVEPFLRLAPAGETPFTVPEHQPALYTQGIALRMAMAASLSGTMCSRPFFVRPRLPGSSPGNTIWRLSRSISSQASEPNSSRLPALTGQHQQPDDPTAIIVVACFPDDDEFLFIEHALTRTGLRSLLNAGNGIRIDQLALQAPSQERRSPSPDRRG